MQTTHDDKASEDLSIKDILEFWGILSASMGETNKQRKEFIDSVRDRYETYINYQLGYKTYLTATARQRMSKREFRQPNINVFKKELLLQIEILNNLEYFSEKNFNALGLIKREIIGEITSPFLTLETSAQKIEFKSNLKKYEEVAVSFCEFKIGQQDYAKNHIATAYKKFDELRIKLTAIRDSVGGFPEEFKYRYEVLTAYNYHAMALCYLSTSVEAFLKRKYTDGVFHSLHALENFLKVSRDVAISSYDDHLNDCITKINEGFKAIMHDAQTNQQIKLDEFKKNYEVKFLKSLGNIIIVINKEVSSENNKQHVEFVRGALDKVTLFSPILHERLKVVLPVEVENKVVATDQGLNGNASQLVSLSLIQNDKSSVNASRPASDPLQSSSSSNQPPKIRRKSF